MSKFMGIYFKLCPLCREKVNKDPSTDISEYCPVCRAMAEPTLEKIQKEIG